LAIESKMGWNAPFAPDEYTPNVSAPGSGVIRRREIVSCLTHGGCFAVRDFRVQRGARVPVPQWRMRVDLTSAFTESHGSWFRSPRGSH
jgi:nitrite reductase/ring-hydroxylating ferredoxin subunit